jgi:TonB family protein
MWLPLNRAAQAEDLKTMLERLNRVDTATALDAPSITPWHIKISVQLFDAQGKPAEQGLIEEWWAGPQLDRITFTVPSYKATELQNSTGFFRTKGAEPPPLMLELLREQVVHPMPPERDIEGTKPETRKEKFGKATLECIMLDRPIKAVAYLPTGLFPTYCMDAGKDSLRASYDYGGQLILRNRVEDFQGRAVAEDIAITHDGVHTASAEVFKLETKPPDDPAFAAVFAQSDDLERMPGRPLRVGAATMAATLLSKVNPKYPEAAKTRNAAGTVTLQAVIGRDGAVQFVRLVAAPDPDLGNAAMDAVKQWIYKPWMLNGEPVEVETTMIVTFSPG